MAKIAILMGSASDMDIMKKGESFLIEMGVECDIFVASAHRNPEKVHEIVSNPDYDIFIAGAGMAAHLPGVVASITTKPVIGVPINASMDGLDALLSISQMPPGIPVATVAINGARNAAILAVQMLALSNKEFQEKMVQFRNSMK